MSNVYEIGIKIGMQNAVSGVLAVISKEMLGLDAHVSNLIKKFNALGLAQKAALGGGIAAAGGAATLAVYGKIVDKGNELVAVQRRMMQAGVSNKEVAEATAKAYQLSAQYQNMSVVENLKLINDARSTFGSQAHATHDIDEFAKADSFLRAYEGGKHGGDGIGKEIVAAMKSGEIAGKISPQEMKEHVAQLVAMRVAYGENLKIAQYLVAQRAGGVALRNTSDEFRYGMFPALVQENGVNAGTMLMTAFNKVVAGVGNRTSSIQEMESIGMLNKDQIKYDKAGRAIGLKDADGIKGSRDAAMNFGSWVITTLKPLLDAKTGGDTIREAQEISKLFPDRNAAKAVTEIIQQFSKFSKDAALQKQAHDVYVKGGTQEGSLDYQKQAIGAQTNTFMETLGAPMVKAAVENLSSLNKSITDMVTGLRGANPGTIEAAGKAMLVVGSALLVLGGAAVVGAMIAFAGPVGIVVAGVTALAAAMKLFESEISAILPKIGPAISQIATEFVTWIGKLPDMVIGSIGAAISAIGKAISDGLSRINPFASTPNPTGYVSPKNGPIKRSSLEIGAPPGGARQTVAINNVMHLDGEVVHRSVERRQVRDSSFARRAPVDDSFGHFAIG